MAKIKRLFIDTEARPGHWIGRDYTSKRLTAVAWAWDDGPVEAAVHHDYSSTDLAVMLCEEIVCADLVIGHNIRKYDLPLLNAEMVGAGRGFPLPVVLTSDTLADLKKTHGISRSQMNLAARLRIPVGKVYLPSPEWEEFNDKKDRDRGLKRVSDDVKQNRLLFHALVEGGWLSGPKAWVPTEG